MGFSCYDNLENGLDGFRRVNPNPTRLDRGQISLTHDRPVYNAGWVTRVKSGSGRVGLYFAAPALVGHRAILNLINKYG